MLRCGFQNDSSEGPWFELGLERVSPVYQSSLYEFGIPKTGAGYVKAPLRWYVIPKSLVLPPPIWYIAYILSGSPPTPPPTASKGFISKVVKLPIKIVLLVVEKVVKLVCIWLPPLWVCGKRLY